MVKDLNFVQLGQMPEDNSSLLRLYALHAYIDTIKKPKQPKKHNCNDYTYFVLIAI